MRDFTNSIRHLIIEQVRCGVLSFLDCPFQEFFQSLVCCGFVEIRAASFAFRASHVFQQTIFRLRLLGLWKWNQFEEAHYPRFNQFSYCFAKSKAALLWFRLKSNRPKSGYSNWCSSFLSNFMCFLVRDRLKILEISWIFLPRSLVFVSWCPLERHSLACKSDYRMFPPHFDSLPTSWRLYLRSKARSMCLSQHLCSALWFGVF